MPEKRILYIATSDVHIATFHLPYLRWLKEQGYVVHLAVENRGNVVFDHVDQVSYLPFPRSPLKRTYISTYKKLKAIIESGNYSLIHCHTPLPSVVARLAARKARKNGTKVLYTAHGFHFYKGAPLKNWLTYYPAEYLLSALTDGIVTINREDFGYINGKMFHKDSFYIKGIGVDSQRFRTFSKTEIENTRNKLGFAHNAFILLYVAEFIPRKNHRFIIEALPVLKKKIPNLKVIFAGKGVLLEQMKNLARKLDVNDVIDFLGFRNDVPRLAAIADVGISSSKHEGLGLGLAEEMLCSVPVVATIDKGHKEMIEHGVNGLFFAQNNPKEFVDAIDKLFHNPELRKKMGEDALKKAQEFTVDNSLKSMIQIFEKYLVND
ncbi:MAG: glycosyltransferase family 4 protein [Lentimicrobium sp.]|nr:glycosyltransferase family 4 protein [Lentimicrobium sp.]